MVKDQYIIECALKIAKSMKYPVLIDDLQPVEDYTVEGELKPGLMTKCERECLELREAFAAWQTIDEKTGERHGTEWYVLHEAADIYYYCRQIERQSGRSMWPVAYRSVRLYLPYKWDASTVKLAAQAKYGWRAAEGKKDEAVEIQLIQSAVLSSSKRGRPPKDREAMTRLNFVCSEELKNALQAAQAQEIAEDLDPSLSEILEREARKSPYLQQFFGEDQHV